MQKTTFYDNCTLFGGYTYQGANGFSYEVAQEPYPPSSHVESDFQRSACSMQPAGTSGPHAKPKDINGSCMRSNHPEHRQPPPVSPPQNPSSNSTQPGTSKTLPKSTHSSTPNLTKQIFPWMKETRQNSKQKNNSSPSSGTRIFFSRFSYPSEIWLHGSSGKHTEKHDGQTHTARKAFAETLTLCGYTANIKAGCPPLIPVAQSAIIVSKMKLKRVITTTIYIMSLVLNNPACIKVIVKVES